MRVPFSLFVTLTTLTGLATAQSTGRTMQLLAPAVIGQTASFGMSHPTAAAGNFYVFLWSSPPFGGAATLQFPGFTLLGQVRVHPFGSVSTASGLLGPTGSVVHTLAIPNDASFVGYSWDLQSADLEASTWTVRFADNDLTLTVANTPPPNMVWIPAGTFQMGSNAPAGSPYYGLPLEQPVHQVTIRRPFWISRFEVTQAEYQAVIGTNPSYFRGANWPNTGSWPVDTVSWNDAMAYCATLNAQQAALGRVPSGYRYRLPTEAEWEYCCRAGTTTEFHYGPTLDCPQARFGLSRHTTSSCSSNSPVAVGSYGPNAWGLHDMHGNLWEWCLDNWNGTQNYPSTAVVDPLVQTGTYAVLRGGAWDSTSDHCRAAFRGGDLPGFRSYNFGFRVVLAPIVP